MCYYTINICNIIGKGYKVIAFSRKETVMSKNFTKYQLIAMGLTLIIVFTISVAFDFNENVISFCGIIWILSTPLVLFLLAQRQVEKRKANKEHTYVRMTDVPDKDPDFEDIKPINKRL